MLPTLYLALASSDILVVGGNGRVGASTVKWLDILSKRNNMNAKLAIGGRSAANFASTKERLGLPDVDFTPVDLDGGLAALTSAVSGASLVVHTAGPFQGRVEPSLLVPRRRRPLHVCDEPCSAATQGFIRRGQGPMRRLAAYGRVCPLDGC